ncbi:hypothetical protein F5X96DRAFT_669350 [Biscogniauxia mediterranea]|nr:hypothetical protein F5X96DRAFT_669350 [Biscogniauxia mediterranea]
MTAPSAQCTVVQFSPSRARALRMLAGRPRWSVEKGGSHSIDPLRGALQDGSALQDTFLGKCAAQGRLRAGRSLPTFPSDPMDRLSIERHRRRRTGSSLDLCLGQRDGDKEISVYSLLIAASDAVWSQSTAIGDEMFLPGQFQVRLDVARRPGGGTYSSPGNICLTTIPGFPGPLTQRRRWPRDMLDTNPDIPPLKEPPSVKEEVPFEFKCPMPLMVWQESLRLVPQLAAGGPSQCGGEKILIPSSRGRRRFMNIGLGRTLTALIV